MTCSELVRAVETIHAGESYFSADVARVALNQFVRGTSDGPSAMNLTNREREVLIHIAEGLSNKEIAQHLNISERRRRWTGACGIRSRALPWRIVGRRLCVRSADQQGPCVRCVLH